MDVAAMAQDAGDEFARALHNARFPGAEEEDRNEEEEEAAGEAVAVAPAVVEAAAAETNHPPASADTRYANTPPLSTAMQPRAIADRVRASPSATGDASATGVDECDTDEEALAAALADEDKWTWGSRVQWWQSDAEWTDDF